ncbi:hypothetical protein [Nocardioides sp. WS12]|uniref:hypothetical protein n=1 Tax=Nocardioides sp. WS12 TaxID=2486272 RepID=UPI0015F9D473|nr:hypothetical protein [Nocardioides sp. WS12]
MSSRLVIGALLVVLLSACGGEDVAPTVPKPIGVADVSSATPSPTTITTPTPPEPSASCTWPDEVSANGSGFVVELNIMSGNPNPAWRLTKAEGTKLRLLVAGHREVLDLDGPDELGGYGVTADGAAVEFLDRRGLPERFWVQGDNEIAEFLGETLPC